MDVFDLSATLSLDTSKYESGLQGAGEKAKAFGSKISSAFKTATLVAGAFVAAGAAVTGVLVSGAKQTADYGDNVDKMSQKLGLSVEGFQKWDYVLKIAGTDINSMSTGLKTLTNKIDDAKNGSSGAQEMFSKLGLSMDELNEMSREEVFEATIKGFQGMADSTERAALANDLFGKSGQNLTPLFNQTAEDTEKQLELAEKYGMVMPEAAVKASAAFEDSLTTMSMTFTGLKNRMMGEFLPAMTQVTDGMAKLFAGDDSGADDVAKGIENIIKKVAEVLPKIVKIGVNIGTELAKGFLNNIKEKLGGNNISDAFANAVNYLVENVPPMIEKMAQAFADNAPKIAEQGAEMILKLGEGLIKALPQLISAAGAIINGLLKVFVGIPALLIAKGMEATGKLALGLLKGINKIATAGSKIVAKIVSVIRQLPSKLLSLAVQAIGLFVSGIHKGIGKAKSVASNLINGAVQAVKNGISGIATAGANLVQGFWQGISNKASWLKSMISGWVGSVKTFLKNLFGIKSPSTWARDVLGKNIDAGFALGIEQNADMIDDAFEDIMPDVTTQGFIGSSGSARTTFSQPTFNTVVNVNGAEDPEEWADRFSNEFMLKARTV